MQGEWYFQFETLVFGSEGIASSVIQQVNPTTYNHDTNCGEEVVEVNGVSVNIIIKLFDGDFRRQPAAVFLVYDANSMSSFEQLTNCIELINDNAKGCEMVLVRYNVGVEDKTIVPFEKARHFARDNGLRYFETESFLEVFYETANFILEKIFKGELDSQQFFINHNNINNGLDKDQRTLVHRAVLLDNVELVQFLVQIGVKIDLQDRFGNFPIDYAIHKKNTQIAKLLINPTNINNVDKLGQTLLFKSIQRGNIELAKFLLQNNALDLNERDRDSLIDCAVQNNQTEVIKLLVNSNNINNTNRNGHTLLHIITQKGDIELVHFLIQSGASLDVKDDSDCLPIDYAIQNNHNEIAKLLLNPNNINSVDKNGCTLLHKATQKGNLLFVQFLLEKGARIDIKDRFGNTARFYAKQNGYAEIANLFPKESCIII
eukprot:TRINITY_DN2301_c0_g1_i1.p1 TRINITY_DN2301_c0_g1~~TRINITY_DN2301_c0_g1_i1.p1  ORF type:complete len:431 (-),score=113.14 TRINITY_DN2301_c0_g1_i1:33-1325(-)